MNQRPSARSYADPDAAPSTSWPRGFRQVVSLLLAVHLIALFVGPCASPPPSSLWAREAERLLDPYLRATFLKDHGYRFFAPNPGPSHLVRYELLNAQDEKTGEGRFPSLDEHWPRLLYHRHFMISESLYNAANIPGEPPGPEAPYGVRAQYARAADLRNTYLDSIARYIARQNPEAHKVRIVMVQHAIPLPEDVAQGRSLSDPSLYEEVILGDYTIEEDDRQ